jgi:hypothetical protein
MLEKNTKEMELWDMDSFTIWVKMIKDLNFIETKAQTHTKLSLLQQV